MYIEGLRQKKNFIKYALFISFFPKLLAGPIERTTTFLPQLQEKKFFNYDNLKNGLLLMLYGYFLKMVIGDRAAILVNFVFDNYEAYMGLDRKDFWVLCFSIIILFIVSFMQERGIKIREQLSKQNLIFRWIIYWIAIFGILTFGIYGPEYDATQFIYFGF